MAELFSFGTASFVLDIIESRNIVLYNQKWFVNSLCHVAVYINENKQGESIFQLCYIMKLAGIQ